MIKVTRRLFHKNFSSCKLFWNSCMPLISKGIFHPEKAIFQYIQTICILQPFFPLCSKNDHSYLSTLLVKVVFQIELVLDYHCILSEGTQYLVFPLFRPGAVVPASTRALKTVILKFNKSITFFLFMLQYIKSTIQYWSSSCALYNMKHEGILGACHQELVQLSFKICKHKSHELNPCK